MVVISRTSNLWVHRMMLGIVNVAGRRTFSSLCLLLFISIRFSFELGAERDNEEKEKE